MNTKDILSKVSSLPLEERALLIDSLLKSFHSASPEIDKNWGELAHERLSEIRSGKIKPVSGKKVFNNIQKRFSK